MPTCQAVCVAKGLVYKTFAELKPACCLDA